MTFDTYFSFMTDVKDFTVSAKRSEEGKTSKTWAIKNRVCQAASWTGGGKKTGV